MVSVVTNVIITGGSAADMVAAELNKWLDERGHGNLLEISEAAGGKKGFESSLWAGAFNYLDRIDFVVEFFRLRDSVRCRGRDDVQLFIQEQQDTTFREIRTQ